MQKYLKKIILQIVGAGCMLFISCTPFALPPTEYSSWILDSKNGLNMSQVSGDFLFRLQYKPQQYIALMNGDGKEISNSQLDKDVNEMGEMCYFTLSISSKDCMNEMLRTGLTDADEYFKRLDYFSFQFKNDLYLVDGSDTIPCVFSHFERSYALSPNNNFLLAFPRGKLDNIKERKINQSSKQRVLLYRDKILHVGDVQLSVQLPAETKIPLVKL